MKYGIVIIPSGYICRDTDGDHKIIAWDIHAASIRAAKWNAKEKESWILYNNTPYKNNYGVFEFTRAICKELKKNDVFGEFRYTGKILDQ